MKLRYWVRNIFGFSRSEANGFLILLPLMILILFSYPIFRWINPADPVLPGPENREIDSILANWDFNPKPMKEVEARKLFKFDPNNVTQEEMSQLGFPKFLSSRIISYRAAGGQFKRSLDLLRIYGMDTSLFKTLEPFISISIRKPNDPVSPTSPSHSAKKAFVKFDLNQADSSQLRSVKGIGPVLAARIVKFRTALGGFINIEQLKEVYGLDSLTIKNIREASTIDPVALVRTLDINASTERQLADHPYIKWKLAKNIVTYRFQHGSFKEIDDLLKLEQLDSGKLARIRPYLSISR